MKKWISLCLVLWTLGAIAQEVIPAPPPPELLEEPYLCEITRHLYRWYMDEADIETEATSEYFTFWIRRATVALDADDHSELVTILLPQLGIEVLLKKSDYTIEELDISIKSKNFRISNVGRVAVPEAPPLGTVVVELRPSAVARFLFETRFQVEYPSRAMYEYLRAALRTHFGLDPNIRDPGKQLVFVAPLSPVANELWAYVEEVKLLVKISSDMDIENQDHWQHQTLNIRTYDVLEQTVISLHQVPGSNAFLTRDQVGRALYNCLILGQRLDIENPETEPAPAGRIPD